MSGAVQQPPETTKENLAMASTAILVNRAQEGDESARNLLVTRFQPKLVRWASGRLPAYARDLNDTVDLVQISFQRLFQHLDSYEPRHPGGFLGYLITTMRHLILDEIQKAHRRPERVELSDRIPAGETPGDIHAINCECMRRLEKALGQLPKEQAQAVILRLELQMTYKEIAEIQGMCKPNTARMRVVRGISRIAEILKEV